MWYPRFVKPESSPSNLGVSAVLGQIFCTPQKSKSEEYALYPSPSVSKKQKVFRSHPDPSQHVLPYLRDGTALDGLLSRGVFF
jgi:hypothetical protein